MACDLRHDMEPRSPVQPAVQAQDHVVTRRPSTIADEAIHTAKETALRCFSIRNTTVCVPGFITRYYLRADLA